jgi:hypothetical protein
VTHLRTRSAVFAFALITLAALSPAAALGQRNVTSTVVTAPSAPIKEGTAFAIKVTVTDQSGSLVPTGTATILVDGVALGGPVPLTNGIATLTVPTTNVPSGTYSLSASYSGDASNAPSSSSAVNASISGTTTTTVSFGSLGYVMGQNATILATVAAPSGNGPPTGTVNFGVGPTVFASEPLVNGVATYAVSTAQVASGTYSITATYVGNTAFQPSSGVASVTVDPAFTVTPSAAGLALKGTQQFALSTAVTGTVTWYVNSIPGGNSTVGTITATGLYTAPSTIGSAQKNLITATVSTAPSYVPAAASAYVLAPGVLTPTISPYVASYTINLPAGSSAAVKFGQTTSYGLNTWTVAAPANGGDTTILVAGMIGGQKYHLEGSISLPGSVTFADTDRTFTPLGITAGHFPTITIPTNTTPSPGIELIDNITVPQTPVFATDLDGNIIWAYTYSDYVTNSGDIVQPVKPLPNGHFLLQISPTSTAPLGAGVLPTAIQVLREIDLTGTTIQQVSIADINQNLVAAGYSNIELLTISHDVTVLPNGHWLTIGNILVPENGLTGYTTTVDVLGDVIVDLDPANNFAVDWIWNEFDHLDVNRHPYMFPDWTHTNAIIYSQDDGNLLISIRHQNWVVKVNYNNGAGDGSILWHLGAQGDFALLNSDGSTDTDLDDWQYAQHGPHFTTANTTGLFGLTLMDNGDDRGVYTDTQCATGTNPACYTTVPLFAIDENTMDVTKLQVDNLGAAYYSYFGGNAEGLANGDIEYNLSAHTIGTSSTNSVIQETTVGPNPSIVWELDDATEQFYRGFRNPSLYPGVTWSEGAGLTEAQRKAHRVAPGTTTVAAPKGPAHVE